jgi:hypothetical protein
VMKRVTGKEQIIATSFACRDHARDAATTREIMSVTSHKMLAEVQRYTDAADKERLAEQAIEKLGKWRGAMTNG